MHGVDLDRYVAARPNSALAALAAAGVRYANVATPFPSDSFPGALAVATGGTPKSTGIYYDLAYDRQLSPPGSKCATAGTVVDFSEDADVDPSQESGGGGLATALLPLNPAAGCQPVFPHQFLRVNTIFEVAHAAGLRTAWFDKHLSYEVLQGPSGKGLDDAWNPEVAAKANKTLSGVLDYDDRKVAALLQLIAGKDHTGATFVGVPAVFGMNFQGVSVTQKTPGSGYANGDATPTATLLHAFDRTDASVGKIVAALKGQGLWSRTLLMVTAVHGDAPIDPAKVKIVAPNLLAETVNAVAAGLVAHVTADAVALFWLTDQSKTKAAVQALQAAAAKLGIAAVQSGADIAAQFADPALDARAPDIIATVDLGVIYATKAKGGEHGGGSDDERKVVLIAAGGSVKAAQIEQPVQTRQIAPTALQWLGLDPAQLQALKTEPIAVLPGLQAGN